MCPICKSEKYNSVGIPKLNGKSKKIINKEYQVVQCIECKFYYVCPEIELSSVEWKLLYDENYFTEQTDLYKRKRAKHRKQRIEKLNALCENDVKNFLDIGCGEGYMLLEAVRNGWKAYGVDITDNRVGDARVKDITFYKSDLLDAKLSENYFDCVYCDSVLEHILNPMEYLLEINRILKPGGVVYIGVPNEDYLLNDIKRIANNLSGNSSISPKLKPFISPYHIGGFNKNSLKYALVKSSFKIEEFRNFATKLIFLYVKFLSKEFFTIVIKSLIYLLSVPLRKEYYIEVYAAKK